MDGIWYEPSEEEKLETTNSDSMNIARQLWYALAESYDRQQGGVLQPKFRLLTYRAANAAKAQNSLLTAWRWALPIWSAGDRSEFSEAMAAVRTLRNIPTPVETLEKPKKTIAEITLKHESNNKEGLKK